MTTSLLAGHFLGHTFVVVQGFYLAHCFYPCGKILLPVFPKVIAIILIAGYFLGHTFVVVQGFYLAHCFYPCGKILLPVFPKVIAISLMAGNFRQEYTKFKQKI